MIHGFPREYHLRPAYRLLMQLLGAVLITGGIVIAAFFTESDPDRVFLYVLAGFLVFGGVSVIRSSFRDRVILHADAIELHEFGEVKRLELKQIRGRRRRGKRGKKGILLEPRRSNLPELFLTASLESDAALQEWLSALKDLDLPEERHSMADYLSEGGDDVPEAELRQRLISARRAEKVLSAAAMLLAIPGVIDPDPHLLWVLPLVVLPVVATLIMARNWRAFTIEGGRNEVRASLGLAFIVPPLVLFFRSIGYANVIDLEHLLRIAAGVTGVLWVAQLWVLPQLRRRIFQALLLVLFMAGHSYGSLAMMNRALDRHEAEAFTAQVRGKYDTKSRRGRNYWLGVSPWGPENMPVSLRVKKGVFEATDPDSRICIDLNQGAFGARWYNAKPCAE